MCKLTLFALLILLVSISAEGQEFQSTSVISRFEFIAGPSFSNNTGYLPEYESKTGYSFGVGYYQKVFKSFSLNVRALHEMKGSTGVYNLGLADENGTVEITEENTTKFNYLTFYLLPTLQLGKKKNLYLGAGGYYSFLSKLSVNTYRARTDTGEFISETTTTDKSFFYPQFDAGVTFQLGYSFKITNKCQMMAQAFTNYGLVDVYNSSFGSQRNNTFGLLLSLRIR